MTLKDNDKNSGLTVTITEHDIEKGNRGDVLTTIISPSGREVPITGDVDEVMKYAIHNLDDHIELTEEASRKLYTKVCIYVLPLICILYCFQFMDKLSNSYASILGLTVDMHMTGDQYSWTGSAFYIGYLAFEFPTSLLLQRFPLVKTVSVFIILWGMVLALGSVTHYAGFIAIRTIQGGLESIITPAFTLYTTFWFTKEEAFFITALWFASNGIGTMLGSGAIAYNIYKHSEGYSLEAWKVVFITTGCLTIFLGIVMAIHLPDTPASAWFLTDMEKRLLVERIRKNQQGFGNKHFKWHQFKEALLDVKTWLFFVFSLVNNIPNGGITNFGSILLHDDLGYATGKSLLMQMPAGAVEIVGCGLLAYCYRFFPNRMFWATLGTAIALAAECMLAFSSNPKVKLAGFTLYTLAPIGFICILSSIGSNILGTTKKQTCNAIFLIGYCVGNLIGPQTFKSNEAPTYTSAKLAIVICGAIALFTLILIWIYYIYENRRRDRSGVAEVQIENIEFADLTDKENPNFRYVI